MTRGASHTTAWRSLSPELNVAWEATRTNSERAKHQRSLLTGSDLKTYSQPAAKKAMNHMAPPDQARERSVSCNVVNILFDSLLSSICGSFAESVARNTEGSAVESPTLSATFWTARPTGRPVTAILRATQGPATRANPPRSSPSDRHRPTPLKRRVEM